MRAILPMDAELRELIDHSRFHQGAIREVAARLPATDEALQAVIAETVAEGDQLGFVMVTVAALDMGRPVGAEHLVGGTALLPTPHWLGMFAWKLAGDVPEALLAALSRATISHDMHAALLFIVAAWCAERRGGELPTGFLAEARRFARTKDLKKEARSFLGALAVTLRDEGFLAVLEQHQPAMTSAPVRPAAEALAASTLAIYVTPVIALVPATPPKLLAHGRPMRRAVEKHGRNELCHCGSGRKYKRCCFVPDQERLHLSTEVAGKTDAELRAAPETGLTEPRINRMPPFELARIDPRKVPETLRRCYLMRLVGFQVLDRVADFFEAVEWDEDRAEEWDFAIFSVMKEQRQELAVRMVAARRERAPEETELRGGIRLLLVRDEPAEELRVLAEIAGEIFREKDPENLVKLGYGVLCSRHTGLGILICRSLIATLPRKDASFLFEQILEARDKLNLPPDELFSDVLEKRLAEEMPDEGRDAADLRAARQRLDAKAAEVRELNARIESQRRELERREKKQAAHAQPAAPAAVDEADLREMRIKLAQLKTTLNERSTERITLRRELEKARDDLDTLRQGQSAPAPAGEEAGVAEAALYLPEQPAGNQPLRLLEFPPKFREALEELPRQVARAALALLGRLAGGEPAAFSGVVALRACPRILRQRIGSEHRLLFHLLPDRVQVIDLINRRDLDRRIRSHHAGR